MMGKRKRSGSWSKGDECGSKKSDDCDSQEELDGDSFIPKANTTNVRCSARVQEKQEKLRREASPSKQIVGEAICPSSCGPGSSSVSVVCKGKTASADDIYLPIPETLPCGLSPGGVALEGKRKKRTWELWSQYDKQLFFEALNEFGKDFDAIQSHLASKLKSKNKTVEPTQIKKKEQVRHFYYRTWNKIQKYLHFPKDMKKAFQELYGLVNYGELRKKQRALNGKTAAKLLELVEKGSTTIKVKGKTQRIKTPVCQALKKINNLADVEHTKVPSKVVVELLPKDGGAWSVVQSLSHNPRVKSLVSLQRTLASIITYLEERWKSSSDRIKEQMMTTFGKRTARRLRVIPSCKRESNVPIFKSYETASSAKISLNAYSSNVLNTNGKDGYVKLVEKRKRKKSGSSGICMGGGGGSGGCVGITNNNSGGGTEGATDSVAEADWSDAEMTQQETKDEGTGGGGTGTYSSIATQLFRNAFGDDTLEVKGMPVDEVQRMLQSIYDLPRIQSLKHEEDDFENGDNENYNYHHDSDDYQTNHNHPQTSASSRTTNNNLEVSGSGCLCVVPEDKSIEPEDIFSTTIDDEILKRGWTAEEAGSLTIGEMYMLVGRNDKLSFEYEWDEGDEDTEINQRTRIMLERLIAVARNLKKKKQSRQKILTGPSISATPTTLSTCTVCPGCGHNINLSSSASSAAACSSGTATTVCTPAPLHSEAHSTTVAVGVTNPNSPQLSTKNPNQNHHPVATNYPSPSVPVLNNGSMNIPTLFDGTENSAITLTCPTTKPTQTTTPASVTSQNSNLQLVTHTLSSHLDSESSSAVVKVKNKITPTMVSSSCTGTILTSVPPSKPLKTEKQNQIDFSSKHPSANTNSTPPPVAVVKEPLKIEETFRVPSSGGVNGNNSSISFTRIRPMPMPIPTGSNSVDNSSGGSDDAGLNRNLKNAPKPFLDLPKGNRRLGRPCCKKNIVPRYLPLLPKTVETPPQPAPPAPPAMWEIVGNKTNAVHTLYVSNAAQLMLPVTSVSLKSSPSMNPQGGCEKDNHDSSITVMSSAGVGVGIGLDGGINLDIVGGNPNPSIVSPPIVPSPQHSQLQGSNNSDNPETLISSANNEPHHDNSSMGCSNFKALLKGSGLEADKAESNLSLSSFMDISLPESTRNVANECLKSGKFLDVTLGSSSCSLSLSNFLNSGDSNNDVMSSLDRREEPSREESLKTPKKMSSHEIYRNQSPPSNLLSTEHHHQWLGTDANDLSLGSLLSTLEPAQPVTSESEMNFQSMIEDSNNHLDFTSKFSELVAELESSNNNKK